MPPSITAEKPFVLSGVSWLLMAGLVVCVILVVLRCESETARVTLYKRLSCGGIVSANFDAGTDVLQITHPGGEQLDWDWGTDRESTNPPTRPPAAVPEAGAPAVRIRSVAPRNGGVLFNYPKPPLKIDIIPSASSDDELETTRPAIREAFARMSWKQIMQAVDTARPAEDGNRIAILSRGGMLVVWNTLLDQPVALPAKEGMPGKTRTAIDGGLRVSPSEKYFITLDKGGNALAWNENLKPTPLPHPRPVIDVEWLNNEFILTNDGGGTLRVFRASTAAIVYEHPILAGDIVAFSAKPDASVLMTASKDGTIAVYYFTQPSTSFITRIDNIASVDAAALTSDGRHVVIAANGKSPDMYELREALSLGHIVRFRETTAGVVAFILLVFALLRDYIIRENSTSGTPLTQLPLARFILLIGGIGLMLPVAMNAYGKPIDAKSVAICSMLGGAALLFIVGRAADRDGT